MTEKKRKLICLNMDQKFQVLNWLKYGKSRKGIAVNMLVIYRQFLELFNKK